MNRRFGFLLVSIACMVLFPFRAPAPLFYVPGEGWYYESYGQNVKWQRARAKEQMDVAEQAFNKTDYNITLHAAHRVLRLWPLSDYAPDAEYFIGRCLEAKGRDEAAFKAYQNIIEKYPRSSRYEDVLWRQYVIANRFLGGEWFRVFWGTIPLYPSMDQTAEMFSKIVNNGPYSDVAPHAQLRIGAAREKQRNFPDAVKAYETAADRYHDHPTIAADALFREGVSYARQAATAEYDQNTAAQAIASFTDFITLFPNDRRGPQAQKAITVLKAEQVRGNFQIARFYEKSKKWKGALVYYNEVLQLDPNSPYAAPARQRIESLKPRIQPSTAD
jgi:outer membrane protein assembly factor BamD